MRAHINAIKRKLTTLHYIREDILNKIIEDVQDQLVNHLA